MLRKYYIKLLKDINKEKWEALICLLLIYLVFNILLVNKFFPVTEGWFQDYTRYIQEGAIAYRDFYCPVPPGALLITTIVCNICGDSFLALRYYGIFERMLLVVLVFVLVHRIYSSRITFLSVLTAAVIYTSTIQDVFFSYYQTSLLFALFSVFFCIKMIEQPGRLYFYSILFGAFSGLSFLVKQNMGSIFAISVGFVTMFLLYNSCKRKIIYAGIIAFCSALVVVFFAGAYLYLNDALYSFINQLFNGAASKGSITNIFFGFLRRMNSLEMQVLLFGSILWFVTGKFLLEKARGVGQWFLFALFLVLPMIFINKYFMLTQITISLFTVAKWKLVSSIMFLFSIGAGAIWRCRKEMGNKKELVYLLSCAFFIGMLLIVAHHNFINVDFMEIRSERQIFIYACFYILMVWIGLLAFKIKQYNFLNDKIKLILVVTAWTNLYTHGMSGIPEDHGTFIMFSLVVGSLLTENMRYMFYKNAIIVIFCIGNIFAVNIQKCEFPYYWWGVNEAPMIYVANKEYKDPKLKGIYGPPDLVNTMDNIYDLINNNKRLGDTMYTFPHINYFNVMSNLDSPTFAKVHYFDVCPDQIAVSDAHIIKTELPSFIVWQKLPDDVWQLHENLFRDGKRSGQREIREVVENKIEDGSYVLLGKYELYHSDPVYIYGINDGRKWNADI